MAKEEKSAEWILENMAAVSNPVAFRLLGIGHSLGHTLLNAHILERQFVGSASRVSVKSIKRLLETGVTPEQIKEDLERYYKDETLAARPSNRRGRPPVPRKSEQP